MTHHPETQTPGGNRANAEENTKTTTGSVRPAAPGSNGRTPQQDKQLSTLIAALALRGHPVHRLADGAGFVCGRWGLFKHCATLDELHAFALRVGAC